MRTIPSLVLAALLLGSAARAEVQVSGSLVLTHDLGPGERTVQGTLTLTNPGDRPAQARLTFSDIKSDPQAGAVYLKAGTLARSNTSWIDLPNGVVTVPARGKLDVPYRVVVPENAMPGAHWGVVRVTPEEAATAATEGKPNGVALRQVVEYAVQVFVNLPGGGAKLKFQNPKLGKAEGGLRLDVELGNAGERLARPRTRVEVYDAQGGLALKLDGRERRVLPDCAVLESYTLAGLKPGRYQVLVIADDESGVVGARYNVTVE